jgi:NTP pyrophosphatase (non-canonical NTP hydrolase)
MKKEFLPTSPLGMLARLVEECGEVMQAVGKGLRFGMSSENPISKETARDQLLRELGDLEHAIGVVRKLLTDIETRGVLP